ncbi:MAG: DegT/DnrJ/EryC1/StrS family aminotransferase [Vulcanimicrobiota bacterium]
MIPIAKPLIGDEEKKRVMEVLDTGMISIGKVVEEFEAKFAEFTGSKYAVATSSGTTALHMALEAAGIGEGDKVVTVPFSFIATSNSILYSRATPVFCDIEEETFNIDPGKLEALVKKDRKIKAVLIVHLYGHPCNMDAINEIVKKYNLLLIEDCAQAHGCYYDDIHVGNFGLAGTFSFYPTKNMTTAEGGLVTTNSELIYRNLRLLREHGMPKTGEYDFKLLGYNYRMTNIEAAIGLAQLEKLEGFNKKRAENAKFFDEHLKNLDWLVLPVVKEKAVHCYHQYTLKVEDRNNFTNHLKENGIGFKVYYPSVLPDSQFYKDMGYSGENYPVSKRMTQQVVSIPVHPGVSDKDREQIVEVIKKFQRQ